MKRLVGFLQGIVFFVTLVLLGIFCMGILSIRKPIAGMTVYSVLSGSMNPSYKTGDMLISQKTPEKYLNIGDVITFEEPGSNGKIVTHRIFSIMWEGGKAHTYKTKGDANDNPDAWVVPYTKIRGKVVGSVSGVGYAMNFARTKMGYILLILIPGLAILLSETVSLAVYFNRLGERRWIHAIV
jgi:signal peptidase I